MTNPDLSGALTLTSPEACLALYRAWADSYDTGFSKDMEYLLPAHVAAAFLSAAAAALCRMSVRAPGFLPSGCATWRKRAQLMR